MTSYNLIEQTVAYDNNQNTKPQFIKIENKTQITIEQFPYIIRNCEQFKVSLTEITDAFLAENSQNIWGYTNIDKVEYEYVKPEILLNNWINDNLTHILVDTECTKTGLIPEILEPSTKNNPNLNDITNTKNSSLKNISTFYTLTKKNHLTNFHIDPDYGNGWMYLKLGRKLWWFISPTDLDYLEQKGIQIVDLKNKSFNDLIYMCDNYLWGKIYIGEIGENDFIYFPKNWGHRVYTFDKAIGLSGYC